MTATRWLDVLPRWGLRTTRQTATGVMVAGLCIAASACASAGKQKNSDQDIHPVAIEIDNNLTVPTELMVYLDQSGIRQMLGSVPGGKSKTFQFTPNSYAQPYRLLGVAQLQPYPFRSQQFTVSGPEMGTVVWNLQANILGFYDVMDATAAPAEPADSTKTKHTDSTQTTPPPKSP